MERGESFVILKCRHRWDLQCYAVKIYPFLAESQEHLLLAKLDQGPRGFFVPYYSSWEEGGLVFLQTHFYSENLAQFKEDQNGPASRRVLLHFLVSVGGALKQLHEQGLTHGNL